MRPSTRATAGFGRHTRSWRQDSGIFSQVDAPVQIGVGKNMVQAIRFWGLAAKLIEKDRTISRLGALPTLFPPHLGHRLFGVSGWDRYMEDPGTLWLLHWLLLAPRSLLPVWWLAFNEFDAVEFTDDDLEAAIALQLHDRRKLGDPHTQARSRKDVSALLRTYAPAEQSGRTGVEDLLDCPLRELNLIRTLICYESVPIHDRSEAHPAASDRGVCCLGLPIACTDTGGNTATISRLAHESGRPREGVQAHRRRVACSSRTGHCRIGRARAGHHPRSHSDFVVARSR